MGVRVGVANFFLNQLIGIDDTNTFQLKFLSSMNIVGVTGFRGLWVLWASQVFAVCGRAYSRNKLALLIRLRNLNLKSQLLTLIVSEISTFIESKIPIPYLL